MSDLQVEQIMKGSYFISEGAGAPEPKIRKTDSESKVVE
ncbi:Uncharacterised protein [uncultured archaeon]|nr:Uncharacterised protein [uncultured archaeon]